MNNHFTADGSTKYYADYAGPIVTATPSRERSERDQCLDDMQALIDWLRANPEVRVHQRGLEIEYCILGDDTTGPAELERIAAAAGSTVFRGRGSDETLNVRHAIGSATYRAFYVPDERMAVHDALMSYAGNVSPDLDVVIDGQVVEPLAIVAGETDA